jgi:YidC/Oxa1 family membrane protein insertase
MTKNVDTTVKTPFMQQQKMLMYVFPIMFAVFGINFPVGVLVYWLTTNVWTMGQQMFVIRRNPTPGSLAFKERQERLKAAGKLKDEPVKAEVADAAPVKRAQPKRQTKSQRQTGGAQPSAAGGGAAKKAAATPPASTAPAADAKSSKPQPSKAQPSKAQPKPNLSKKK